MKEMFFFVGEICLFKFSVASIKLRAYYLYYTPSMIDLAGRLP